MFERYLFGRVIYINNSKLNVFVVCLFVCLFVCFTSVEPVETFDVLLTASLDSTVRMWTWEGHFVGE